MTERTSTESGSGRPAPEYRLEVGGLAIALCCPQRGLAEGLSAWFGQPGAPGSVPAPVTLEVRVEMDGAPAEFPRSLLTSKRLLPREDAAAGQPFDIADGLLRGWYDAATGQGAVTVKAALLEGPYTRIFEQVLYQALASAHQRSGRDAWLVHSSAVIAGGQGFLFVGPSGAGKSTVARLSAAHHVLGDEMSLLLPRAGAAGWELVGTPFNGLFRGRRPGRAPLRAVVLLEHGARHELVDVPQAEAVARLGAEIVPPVGLDQVPGPGTLPAMIDAASRIAAAAPPRVLRFTPDAGLWAPLAAAFGLADISPESSPKEHP